MAIQPIDLQGLLTQIDKVGKNMAFQHEGMKIQQALQGMQSQQRTDEQIQSVNEAQDTGEGGAEKVKDRRSRGRSAEEERGGGKSAAGNSGDPEEEDGRVIRDPALGKHVDFSG
ncbi:hypothetical protein AGMMS49928_14870 [Spirochaetia bacterium]|nr:hypothetical protein AGMMS49928_14870 [Spirochaetia bacterium]